MKLAEVLIRKGDLAKRIASLRSRLKNNCLIQEGETPQEDPSAIIAELESAITEHERLQGTILAANMRSRVGDRPLCEVLLHRNSLMVLHAALAGAVEAARPSDRYGLSEIRWSPVIDGAATQKRVDDIAAQIQELNIKLQEVNWQTEV